MKTVKRVGPRWELAELLLWCDLVVKVLTQPGLSGSDVPGKLRTMSRRWVGHYTDQDCTQGRHAIPYQTLFWSPRKLPTPGSPNFLLSRLTHSSTTDTNCLVADRWGRSQNWRSVTSSYSSRSLRSAWLWMLSMILLIAGRREMGL